VILSEEEVDGVLLVAIDPAGEDQEQQVPWLRLRFHVPPDAGRTAEGKPAGVVRSGAAASHGPPTGSHLSGHLAERLLHPTFSIKIPISALEWLQL